ncbi:MAG TPA: hypothetical protein VET87_01115 [Rubrivivax sp.]|nr:hypothetical protein [Rubrivivax sp.]
MARQNPGIYASIRALQIAVLVGRAMPQDPSIKPCDAPGTPTRASLAQEFRHGRDLHLACKAHLLPMEDLTLVARLIAEAMARRHIDAIRHGRPRLADASSAHCAAMGSVRDRWSNGCQACVRRAQGKRA